MVTEVSTVFSFTILLKFAFYKQISVVNNKSNVTYNYSKIKKNHINVYIVVIQERTINSISSKYFKTKTNFYL